MSPRFERRSGGPYRDGGNGGRGAGGRDGESRDGGRPPGRFSGGSERRSAGERSGGWAGGGRSSNSRAGGGRPGPKYGRPGGGGGGRFSGGRSGVSSRRSEDERFAADRRDGDRRPRREDARGEGRYDRSYSKQDRFRDRPQQTGERERGQDRFSERRRSGDERRQTPNRSRTAVGGARPDRNDRPAPPLQPEAAAASAPPDDLVWGRHASLAALESGRPIHRIWCTPEMRSAAKFLQLLRQAKASGVLVEEVTWARLGQITGGSVHQGIALQTAAAETLDLDTLIEGCADLGESPLLLALDGVTDPHNLGAVVRSAEAMGAHGVVLPQRRSAGLTGSAAKVAAGALEHMPVARVVNLNRSLEKLKDAGYRVIGLAAEGDVTLTDVDLDGPLVLVTGSEDQGLSLMTRRHCDQLVRIPLRGITPSLNASVATALCVYEVARRNWMKDIHGQAPSPPIVRPRNVSEAVETEATVQSAESDPQPTDKPSLKAATEVQPVEINLSASFTPSDLQFDQSIQLSP